MDFNSFMSEFEIQIREQNNIKKSKTSNQQMFLFGHKLLKLKFSYKVTALPI